MQLSTTLRLRTFILITVLFAAVAVWWPYTPVSAIATDEALLTVRFLQVGQGDAVQIITPDGYELLIDGGPDATVLRELARNRSFFDRYIDIVVATHPDADHITGLIDVLHRYDVGTVIETASQYDTATAVSFQETVAAERARIITAQAGQTVQLGASTTVRILSPRGDSTDWETNTASVVVQVVYGTTEFMLTGDAPQGIEKYLVATYGNTLESDVLKLGHHGSDTASAELFLATVAPQYAVVSAGKDNRYGHPKPEVVARAGAAGARIVSTVEGGTITFYSDGIHVWQN